MCQQLSVEVQSGWKACSLATPPFTTSWERMEELVLLENALALPTVEHHDVIAVNAQTKK
jgi:hypothetical protein